MQKRFNLDPVVKRRLWLVLGFLLLAALLASHKVQNNPMSQQNPFALPMTQEGTVVADGRFLSARDFSDDQGPPPPP